MKPVNDSPVEVDFNNRDEDGAVRLHLPVTQSDLEQLHIALAEGQCLWVTDNEVEMTGRVTLRDGIWVLVPDKGGEREL